MAFKVFAAGQSLAPGSNAVVVLDPPPAIEGCGGVVVDGFFDPGVPMMVQLPAGEYTVTGSATFAGTSVPTRHVQVDAFDSGVLYETTGQVAGSGPTLTAGLTFTITTAPGWVTMLAGPGSGVSGQSVTSASFIELTCGGVPWTVGRVSWGSRGAWH